MFFSAPDKQFLIFRFMPCQLTSRSYDGLISALVTGALLYSPMLLAPLTPSLARIAVVGAGLAGLTAARTLARAGMDVSIFEGSDRVGGRVRSVVGHFAQKLTVELGAEFIDSGHVELLALARELGLRLIDTQAPGEEKLDASWHFSGRMRSDPEILREFKPLASRMRVDAARLSANPSALRHSAEDERWDRLSIADYLRSIGANNWFSDLLETAYLAEYGLEIHEQSCLNLLSLIALDPTQGFRVYGDSDERYKILGGNEKITQAMASELGERILLGHRLSALKSRENGFDLDFGSHGRVEADFVVLAIPFSTLRHVDLSLSLPTPQRLAIETLGYGSGEKLIVGLNGAPWRDKGFDGAAFTDRSFQSGWDSRRGQNGGFAYSFFVGGDLGGSFANIDATDLAHRFALDAEALFPGFQSALNGSRWATAWTASPWSRGSYSCYKPGQWTTLAGWESAPFGNLHFAGEHCGGAFQGFMNGAVQSGRLAAEAILRSRA